MSPERFEGHLTAAQARVVARELDRIREDLRRESRIRWHRTLSAFLFFAVAITIGSFLAIRSQNVSTTALHRVDQITRDQAAAAKKAAFTSAKSAYAACRRQQEQAIAAHKRDEALKQIQDPDVQKALHDYFHFAKAQGLLTIPKCVKPPGGTA